MEKAANASFGYITTNRWLGLRLDLLSWVFTVATACIVIGFKGSINPVQSAYVLQVISDTLALFSISIRSLGELHNYITSSQRIIEYTKLPGENYESKELD